LERKCWVQLRHFGVVLKVWNGVPFVEGILSTLHETVAQSTKMLVPVQRKQFFMFLVLFLPAVIFHLKYCYKIMWNGFHLNNWGKTLHFSSLWLNRKGSNSVECAIIVQVYVEPKLLSFSQNLVAHIRYLHSLIFSTVLLLWPLAWANLFLQIDKQEFIMDHKHKFLQETICPIMKRGMYTLF
jgi:hypothetical protein